MYLYGSIEQVGTGTEMIVEKCMEYDLPIPDFQQNEIFKLTLWRESREENEESRKKSAEKIFQLICNNPKITQKELVQLTGLSRQGVEKNIGILKAKGLIQRIGHNKGGYLRVL